MTKDKLYTVIIGNEENPSVRNYNVIAESASEAIKKIELDTEKNEYVFEIKFTGEVHAK